MEKHIAFCINDGYARYVSVVLKSLSVNNREDRFCIHILTDYLSDASIKTLQDQCGNNELQIHVVDDTKLKRLKDTWSVYTWYRILLPEILPDVDKVLYLDAETLITSSIAEFFELDMADKAVAGVIDVQAFNPELKVRIGVDANGHYICAGVLMMNLDYWRTHDIADKIIKWAVVNDKKIEFPDQDAINAVCVDSKIVLPMKYGVLDAHFHIGWRYSEEMRRQALEALDHPVIVHYAGQAPWIYERMYHQFQHLWDEYNSMLEIPVEKIHFEERNNSLKLRVRRFLDRIHIWRLPRWYASPDMTYDELRINIEDGHLMSNK